MRELREQLVISRPEAIRVGDPVSHGHDDTRQRSRRRPDLRVGSGCDEQLTKPVLVARTCRRQARLVRVERGRQKRGLLEEFFRTTISVPVPLELLAEVPIEVGNAPAEASNEVVQIEHLRKKTGPDVKRRCDAFVDQTAGNGAEDHFPFEGVEQRRRRRKPRGELLVPVAARAHERQNDCRALRCEQSVFEGPAQLLTRRARRHQQKRVARRGRREAGR